MGTAAGTTRCPLTSLQKSLSHLGLPSRPRLGSADPLLASKFGSQQVRARESAERHPPLKTSGRAPRVASKRASLSGRSVSAFHPGQSPLGAVASARPRPLPPKVAGPALRSAAPASRRRRPGPPVTSPASPASSRVPGPGGGGCPGESVEAAGARRRGGPGDWSGPCRGRSPSA